MASSSRAQWEAWYEGNKNRVSCAVAHHESDSGNALAGQEETPRFNGRVDIQVVSYLHQGRDPDGDFLKYVLDALVDRGILVNDTSEEIREIRHSQEIISKNEQEQTIITIREI